jgi:hypothetical protein
LTFGANRLEGLRRPVARIQRQARVQSLAILATVPSVPTEIG